MLRGAGIAARVTAALLAGIGPVACGSSEMQAPTASQCTAGHYCVSVGATGSLQGRLVTTNPPAGFAVVCRQISRPHDAWIAHMYGTLDGKEWHLVVETDSFTGPGAYSALLTFGPVQPASGISTGPPADAYTGEGTATVGAGGASAVLSGVLKATPASRKISLSGSVSCSSAASM